MPRSRSAVRPRRGRCSTGCWSCGSPTRSPWTATSSRACSSTASPALAGRGVDVLWPRSLGRDLTASAVLDRSRPMSEREAQLRTGIFGEGELFSFRWQLAVHGDPLTDEEMDQLAASAAPLLRLRGNWTVIDPAIARKARKRVVRTATPAEAIAAALTGTVQLGTAEQPVEEQVHPRRLAAAGPRAAAPRRGAGARRRAGRAARHAARLPAAGADLAGRAHLPRPRRVPGRRHGARQDDHPDRPAPAPRRGGSPGSDARRLPGQPPRQLGAGARAVRAGRRGPPVPRRQPFARGADPAGSCSRRTAPCGSATTSSPRSAGTSWSPTRRSTSRTPARRRPRRCARSRARVRVALTGTPDGEQPHRALVDPRLGDPRAARQPAGVPAGLGLADRGGRARVEDPAVRGPDRAVPAAPPQVRPRHRAGAAGQDRDRPPAAA